MDHNIHWQMKIMSSDQTQVVISVTVPCNGTGASSLFRAWNTTSLLTDRFTLKLPSVAVT